MVSTEIGGTAGAKQMSGERYRPQSWRQLWESEFETEPYRWEGLPIAASDVRGVRMASKQRGRHLFSARPRFRAMFPDHGFQGARD